MSNKEKWEKELKKFFETLENDNPKDRGYNLWKWGSDSLDEDMW